MGAAILVDHVRGGAGKIFLIGLYFYFCEFKRSYVCMGGNSLSDDHVFCAWKHCKICEILRRISAIFEKVKQIIATAEHPRKYLIAFYNISLTQSYINM
jgi:hypothetical protein